MDVWKKTRLSKAVNNYFHKGRRELGRSRKRWYSHSLQSKQASSLFRDDDFDGFTQSHHTNDTIIHYIRAPLTPTIFIPIRYSPLSCHLTIYRLTGN